MLNISVALLNGNHVSLRLSTSSTVQDVRTKAQRAFGKKYLKLVTAKNGVLVDFEQTLEEAGIEDGECLTALAFQPQLAATSRALALRCHGDGSIVTWGRADYGGDSSAVQNQLPRRARRPPGPVLTKVQGAKGRKTYRAFSGLLHQDVLGALGLCADNSTGCELEKHVRRLVGSLP